MLETDNYLIEISQASMIIRAREIGRVIFSVPHDGLAHTSLSGFFEPRAIGYKGRDVNVWPIVKDILQMTHASAVFGLMPRALVDYNRSWPQPINYYPFTQKEVHTALDDTRLAPVYYYYHEAITALIQKAIEQHGLQKVLLIDMHGFKKQPPYAPQNGFDLILGTGNRISIPHGTIDQDFASFMTDRGYKVFLPQAQSIGPQEDFYSADFTTRHHSEKHNINVLQIEIASRFRSKEGIDAGKKLSRDIAEFINSLN